jgi:hypothetical protein
VKYQIVAGAAVWKVRRMRALRMPTLCGKTSFLYLIRKYAVLVVRAMSPTAE